MKEKKEIAETAPDNADSVKNKEGGYILYVFTFIGLSVLTLLAVGLTQIRLTPGVTVALVLIIATIQATIVLFYNMHLKFHDKILIIFVGLIFTLIFLTIIVTLVDYIYR